ncbi:hypothetical protein SD81_036755 [Tolypothrix campylonemoides VB511288]|nr:hypothetical protein SD81_036755 [Tolypothrix campylonemoides VB511288]
MSNDKPSKRLRTSGARVKTGDSVPEGGALHECAAALLQIAVLVVEFKQASASRILIPSLHAIACQFSSALAYHLKKATLNEAEYHLSEVEDEAKVAS